MFEVLLHMKGGNHGLGLLYGHKKLQIASAEELNKKLENVFVISLPSRGPPCALKIDHA